MVDFIETSVYDLARVTEFIHYIKPMFKDWVVIGIEKIQPLDLSIVLHLTKRHSKSHGDDRSEREVLILSAEYIYEHQYWKGNKDDKDRV